MTSSSETQMPNVNINKFDDDYTIRRKQAYGLEKNFDTLIKLDDFYVNLEDDNGYYKRYFEKNPNSSFISMYDDLIEEYDYLFVLDIIMSFADYMGATDVSRDEDYLNQFGEIDSKRKYESSEVFMGMFNGWVSQRKNYKDENEEYYDIISVVQNDINFFEEIYDSPELEEKLISSKFELTDISVVISPLDRSGDKIRLIDGLNIFNNSRASSRIPYIKYNNSDKSYYKIYTGEDLDDIPNYDNINVPESESNIEHIIYLKLWIENVGLLCKAGKKNFIRVTYNLKFNKISFTLPKSYKNITEDDAILYIEEAFPNLSLEKIKKQNIKGEFNLFRYSKEDGQNVITPISFIEYNLLDMITSGIDINRPPDFDDDYGGKLLDQWKYLLGTYLYLDESEKPNADKKSLQLNYRSLTSELKLRNELLKDFHLSSISKVSFEMVNNKTLAREDFEIEDLDTIMEMQKDVEYIYVRVSAKTEEDLNMFIKLIKILLFIHITTSEETQHEYEQIFEDSFLDRLVKYQKSYVEREAGTRENTKSNKLKKLANDIFVSDYPKICPRPPTYVPEENLEYWESKTIPTPKRSESGVGTIENNPIQILPFPKHDSQYHFVCDYEKAHYIGVVKNTLSNKETYPYLPCCYQTDHQNPNRQSEYNKYYRNIEYDPRGSKNKGMIKGKFILFPNRNGGLPTRITDLLKLHSKKPVEFSRYGVVRSTNSFIHCLCKATSDEQYLEYEAIDDINDREESLEAHVKLIRESLIAWPNLFKQELYDRTNDQIITSLLDHTIFFDPFLFYRGLEELFNVNIFVFVPESSNPLESENLEEGDIEIPRNWLFHVTSFRSERKTVIIYKHKGSSRDSPPYPQCEIIVQGTPEGHLAIFESSMYDICYAATVDQTKTLTWFPDHTNEINGHGDIYSGVNYNKLINYSAYEQYIDSHGKCRALIFQVSDGNKIYDMSIIIPPSQPESLPLIGDPKELHRAYHEVAIAIFGNFSKVDIINGNVSGLWFRLFDVDQGVYVPIVPVLPNELGVTSEEQVGDNNPIFGHQDNKASRYEKLKQTINVFMELLKWLYETYKFEENLPDGNVKDFITKYIVSNEYTGDSLNYYDFYNIDYKILRYPTVKEAMSYIQNNSTGMIILEKGLRKISAYNGEFAQSLVTYIEKYNKTTEGLDGNPSGYISDYFRSINNFKKGNNTLIFLGTEGYLEWLEKMIYGPFEAFNINYKLGLNKAKLMMPYIVKENNKYYIIQNVLKGEYPRALNVSLEWFKHRINSGYNSDHISYENSISVNVIIYGITASQKLTQIMPIDNQKSDVIEILRYGSDLDQTSLRYAAMLPLN